MKFMNVASLFVKVIKDGDKYVVKTYDNEKKDFLKLFECEKVDINGRVFLCYKKDYLILLFAAPEVRMVSIDDDRRCQKLKGGILVTYEFGDKEYFPYSLEDVRRKYEVLEGVFYEVIEDYQDFHSTLLNFWNGEFHKGVISEEKYIVGKAGGNYSEIEGGFRHFFENKEGIVVEKTSGYKFFMFWDVDAQGKKVLRETEMFNVFETKFIY